jgi:signal transduction histidine kinase
MDVVGFGKTEEEKDRLIILAMLCLCAGIFAADSIVRPGFVIWGLYLVPLLMSIWLARPSSPFFTALLISGALMLGGFAGPARPGPSELVDRIVFVLIMAVVAFLIWEIRLNQSGLEREIAERRAAQDKLVELTRTLEIRVTDRTRELSEVNELLKHDIIERAKSDRALRAANQKLNILSSVTRHDILNKLMALLTFLDLSKEEAQTNPVMLEYTGKELEIATAIQRQIEFTRDYQDLGVKAPAWEDVAAIIRRAAESLKVKGLALDIAIRGLEVYADPLIEKVFYNLMENSIRHGGQVTTISVWYFNTDSGVVIVYADNGVGIPAQDKERIFLRGFGKHTGLGMFLSREILSITGLTVHETGEPGKGARFDIAVPAEFCRFVPKAG